MEITKPLFYALSISIVFLLVHIAIAYFKLSDAFTLVFTMIAMILAQVCAFVLLKNGIDGRPLTFTNILAILCMTQAFCVILLSLNSAYNPFIDNKPVNISEVLISLLIFAVVFPLIVTAVIWYTAVKAKMS